MTQAAPAFGFQQLTGEIIRGVVETVAERTGDTEAQRFARTQTVVFSIMAFLPRDAMETMLAGQCVVFDHVLRDGARDLLRGQAELIKLRARPQLNATGNMILKTLSHLDRLKSRPGEQALPTARLAESASAPPARAASPAPPIRTPAPAPARETVSARAAAFIPAAPAPSLASLRNGVSLTAMAIAFRGVDQPLPAEWDFGAAIAASAPGGESLPGAA